MACFSSSAGLADLWRLHQEQDHRRHQQHHLDALALDRVQHRGRHELAHHMVGCAGIEARDRPAGAADMEHRQADDVGHAGLQQPALRPLVEHELEVGVGELGALRQAGRAAGVELDRGVVDLDRHARIGVGMAVAPLGETQPGAVAGPQRHDPAHGLELALDLLDDWKELLADEQDLGLGIVHDVQDFGCGEPPVYGHHDGARLGDAEQEVEVEVAALVEMGDAHARLDALGDQAVGDPAGRPVERAIGHRASFIDDGRRVGPLPPVDADDVRQAHHLDAHRTPSPLRRAGILRRFWSEFKSLIA
jgi:hypothetical protein